RGGAWAMTLTLLSGLGEIDGRYDGLILDLWGVLHDGTAPFPGVVDALSRLKQAGKRLCVLSNAPRRAHLVEQRMNEIGLVRGLYDHVHSSGEEAWQHLLRRDDPFYAALGRRCYHIGPARDDNMLEGVDLERVAEIEEAEFILNTGPSGWDETVEQYEALLREARARDLRWRGGATLRGAGRPRALARQALSPGLRDLLCGARHRRSAAHPRGRRQLAHRHRRRQRRRHRQPAGHRRHPCRGVRPRRRPARPRPAGRGGRGERPPARRGHRTFPLVKWRAQETRAKPLWRFSSLTRAVKEVLDVSGRYCK